MTNHTVQKLAGLLAAFHLRLHTMPETASAPGSCERRRCKFPSLLQPGWPLRCPPGRFHRSGKVTLSGRLIPDISRKNKSWRRKTNNLTFCNIFQEAVLRNLFIFKSFIFGNIFKTEQLCLSNINMAEQTDQYRTKNSKETKPEDLGLFLSFCYLTLNLFVIILL